MALFMLVSFYYFYPLYKKIFQNEKCTAVYNCIAGP